MVAKIGWWVAKVGGGRCDRFLQKSQGLWKFAKVCCKGLLQRFEEVARLAVLQVEEGKVARLAQLLQGRVVWKLRKGCSFC